MLSLYRSTYITIFNKDMFTDAGQPFLYEHVENGTWTLDKQISLVPVFHRDNGNNAQDKTGDVYGFVSNDFISVDPYWSSCEVDIIKKNNDGDYEWVFDSAKLYDVTDKVLELYYGTDGGSYIENDDVASEGTVVSIYSAGNAATATLRIAVLETDFIRGMPQERGCPCLWLRQLRKARHRGVRERCVGGLQHRFPKRLRRLHGPLRRGWDLLLLLHRRHERRRPRIQSSALRGYRTRQNAGLFARGACEHPPVRPRLKREEARLVGKELRLEPVKARIVL